jgi:ABC-type transport system involved in cytochrome bd biosynthesis fused ATPase/permease subunit
MESVWIVVGVFMFLNAILWIAQFMDLMTMADDEFPGRFDKALWVLVFVVLFVLVAPIAFSLWKERNSRRLRSRGDRSPGPGTPG